MRCPDHPKELQPRGDGNAACSFCGGAWLDVEALERLSPGVGMTLALETREKSAAFAKVRHCPECQGPMVPWRLDKLEAWLEKCPSCERFWAEKQDVTTLQMLGKRHARAEAMKTLTQKERLELAKGLAESVVTEAPPPDLSPVQYALMYVGVPSVTRVAGNKVPWATWALALSCVLVFVLGKIDEDAFGAFALSYTPQADGWWPLLTATFAHFSWFHLLGNVGFLLAFGDGAEQRVPRWLYVFAFLFIAPVFTWAEGAITGATVPIGGASGAVAMVMGACVVLQPKAKVWFLLLGRHPVHVPMLWFGAFELLYQAVMAAIGVGGVAWWAHMVGLGAGVALGLAARMFAAPQVQAARSV